MRELIFEHITNGNDVYMDCLETILGDTERNSMLDIGCNLAPHTPLFNFKKRKYIDILPRILDYQEEQPFYEQADGLEYLRRYKEYYNVIFALDQIEHVTINYGVTQINTMKEWSDKQIFFTPLDDIFGFDYVTDNPEAHRSLWQPGMIESMFPDTFIFLTFPNYHSVWNGGAFFFVSSKGNIDKEFERITNEINKYSWHNK